ncbi:hypothetical protein BC834DRAFT_971995 [Gloeopeniophorella convolvens]|nr:hypothetical protein BC834DRAFT_971995 [Gloeopeniophorella convolvens]
MAATWRADARLPTSPPCSDERGSIFPDKDNGTILVFDSPPPLLRNYARGAHADTPRTVACCTEPPPCFNEHGPTPLTEDATPGPASTSPPLLLRNRAHNVSRAFERWAGPPLCSDEPYVIHSDLFKVPDVLVPVSGGHSEDHDHHPSRSHAPTPNQMHHTIDPDWLKIEHGIDAIDDLFVIPSDAALVSQIHEVSHYLPCVHMAHSDANNGTMKSLDMGVELPPSFPAPLAL